MRIYRIVEDVNNYQSFCIDEKKWKGDLLSLLTFDCSSKGATWGSPPVFVLHPKLKRGHFYYLCPGGLVIDGSTTTLDDLLEMSGELLPITYNGKPFSILNVTECIDALDHDETEWVYERGSGPIRRYAFDVRRLTETPLFKIPETCKSEILTCEGLKDPDDEFKPRVEALGLKGLVFEEVWTS